MTIRRVTCKKVALFYLLEREMDYKQIDMFSMKKGAGTL